MRPAVRIGLVAAGFLLALAATLPLSLVARVAPWVPPQLSADEAAGTPWHGVLRNARWNERSLGDVRIGLRPWPLLLGRKQWRLATAGLDMRMEGGGRTGFEHVNGQLDYPLSFLPGSTASLEARNAGVLFAKGQCLRAGGRVRAVVQLALADLPGLELTGQPACDGPRGVLVMSTAPGAAYEVSLRWELVQEGTWQVRTQVRSEDPAARMALQAAGFQSGPDGLVRADGGHLGGGRAR